MQNDSFRFVALRTACDTGKTGLMFSCINKLEKRLSGNRAQRLREQLKSAQSVLGLKVLCAPLYHQSHRISLANIMSKLTTRP